MPIVDLRLQPQRTALLAGHQNSLDVLVRAIAPAAPARARARAPLNLALVLDRSGSMSGRPLEEARRCAGMIVDRLAATDRASLVVYDDAIDVLVPAQPVRERGVFHAALRRVDPGRTTALHGGWLRGAEQAALGAQAGPTVSRVLLLSDGCANAGLTDPQEIAAQCGTMAEAGISTSTYGLGESFNEELMAAMARAGLGNAYYGRSAEDLIDPFGREFDLLAALCARNLRLVLAPAAGVEVRVVNAYPVDADGRSRLPDLAYEGEVWALLRLSVPERPAEEMPGGLIHLLTATLLYDDGEGHGEMAGPVHLRLPLLPQGAFAAVAEDELVVRRAAELRAAELQEQARLVARQGDWQQVEQLLGELRAQAAHSPWLAATIAELERMARLRETEAFSKEAYYKARSMRGRMSSPREFRDWDAGEESQMPSYLRRKLEEGRRSDPDNPEDGAK